MASIGIIAYSINSSTEQTNKVSFKAAGVEYKDHFTVTDISSQDVYNEVKYRKNSSSSITMQKNTSQNPTDKQSLLAEAKQVKISANSTFTMAEKRPLAKENKAINSDLRVLSSFDCVKSIPKVLLEYTSNLFLNEYGRSHADFHSQRRIDETVPLMKKFNINCGIDQNCSTSFQYDKQYGLNTTADNTFLREDVFYCCPSVYSLANETTSNICKHAQAVVGKSVLRESKDSTFLGPVIEFVPDVALQSCENL